MSVGLQLALAKAFASAMWSAGITHALWPWDWRGKRRKVVLRRDRRPFE